MKKTFAKGKPKTGGRTKGTKNKSTLLFTEILEDKKSELISKAIDMALKGNATIMNKLLDKMLPNIQPMVLDPEGNLIPEIIIHVRDNKIAT